MRKPLPSLRQPRSGSEPVGMGSRTANASGMIRNRYVTAFTMNRCDREKPIAARNAASAGPAIRVPLIIAELRLMAPERSRRSTSIGMLALNAGALIVFAMPIGSCATKIVHSAASLKTRKASTIDIAIIADCMMITSRVRSNRSASMPDGMESSRGGPSCTKIERPTSDADPVRPST